MSFVNSYSDHFVLSTHDVTEKARQYTRGLMQAGARKNMDRMAEVVPDAKSRNLQQFLTHSTWDDQAVINHVAHDVNELIGDRKSTGLIIDESSFAKQGKMSVGIKIFGNPPGHIGQRTQGSPSAGTQASDEKAQDQACPKGVGEIVTSIPDSDWSILELRDTTRGKLKIMAWKQTVYVWDESSSQVYRWQLVATEHLVVIRTSRYRLQMHQRLPRLNVCPGCSASDTGLNAHLRTRKASVAVKAFFETMAEEEARHIDMLEEQFRAYTQNGAFTAPPIDGDPRLHPKSWPPCRYRIDGRA